MQSTLALCFNDGHKFLIPPDGLFSVGRAAANHAVVPAADMSPVHAYLQYNDGVLWLMDVSEERTVLNATPMLHQTWTEVARGADIQFSPSVSARIRPADVMLQPGSPFEEANSDATLCRQEDELRLAYETRCARLREERVLAFRKAEMNRLHLTAHSLRDGRAAAESIVRGNGALAFEGRSIWSRDIVAAVLARRREIEAKHSLCAATAGAA